MALTGPEVQTLHKAIIAAFSADELARLVRFNLNVHIADIAPSTGTRSDVVVALSEWADRRGRAIDLVRAAANDRPLIEEFRRLLRLLELDDGEWALMSPRPWDPVPPRPRWWPKLRRGLTPIRIAGLALLLVGLLGVVYYVTFHNPVSRSPGPDRTRRGALRNKKGFPRISSDSPT
jgi:hypothetical protein